MSGLGPTAFPLRYVYLLVTMSSVVDKFTHDENMKLFRVRLAETSDEKQRQVLHDLIAEQEAKYHEWQLGPERG